MTLTTGVLFLSLYSATSFVAPSSKPVQLQRTTQKTVLYASGGDGPLGFLKRIAQEVDDIVDDAMMKKLGNGNNFYGKRKSNFYGKDDKGKRQSEDDNAEYNGPKGGSYFKLDREGRPVTRRGTPLFVDQED